MNRKSYTLDIGCGKGPWLEEHGGDGVIGMDVSLESLKIAQAKAMPETDFILADAHHLPFKDKSINIVHAVGPLHHMEDYKLGIYEINRVLDGLLELDETVSDMLLVHIARRIMKGHQGMPVKSLFKSKHLIDEVGELFQINKAEYQSYFILGLPLFHFGIRRGPLYKTFVLLSRSYQTIYKKLGQPRFLTTSVRITACNNSTAKIFNETK
jgi:SAM-dependent methyltransferase